MVACTQTPYFGHAISTLQPLWFDNLLIESKQTAQYPNLSAVHRQELESLASDQPQIGPAQSRAVLAMVKEEIYPMDIDTRQVNLRSSKVEMKHTAKSIFSVQPNPASDHLWITYPNVDATMELHFKVSDLLGREIFSRNLNSNKGLMEINTESWKSGFYFIELYMNNAPIGVQKIEIIR